MTKKTFVILAQVGHSSVNTTVGTTVVRPWFGRAQTPTSHVSAMFPADRADARGWRTFVPSEPCTHVHGHGVKALSIQLCLLALGLASAGLVIDLNLPWLIAENHRIEPWKVPLVWSSETAALVVFVHYCLTRIVPDSLLPPHKSRGTLKGFLVAAAIDVGFSVDGMIAERLAHSSAAPAEAQVTAGYSFLQTSGHRRYSLTCSFRDRNGQVQRAWFSQLAREVPLPVRRKIDEGKLPVPLEIVYDPSWPHRSWPAGLPYSDDNRIFLYSLSTLILSGLLSALLATLGKTFAGLPPPEVAPFVGAVFFLYFGAMLQG